MDKKQEVSVCRAFYEKFPQGRLHVHSELVNFLMKDSSIRKKLDEWIHSEDAADAINSQNQNSSDIIKQSVTLEKDKFNALWKCDIKSKKERELGNLSFKSRDYMKSLQHYNQAIRLARFPTITESSPNSSADLTCLSVAIANRSALYFDMGERYYEKSLKDISLSIKYGYPQQMKSKLLLRKENILIHQGKLAEAQECMEEILSCHNTFKSMDQEKMEAKIESTRLQIQRLLQEETFNETIPENQDADEPFCENETFEMASNLVSMATNSGVGRHVIANCDLQEGTTLFKEIPYASVLLPDFYESHCHHCHKCLQDNTGKHHFFPCRRCTQVLFCDEHCFEAAEFYHIYECGWLGLLHSVGIAHLAFRTVVTAGAKKILRCAMDEDEISDLSNLELFRKGNDCYDRVYSLMHHVPDMFEEDLFQYTLTACLLTELLKTKSSFLENISQKDQDLIGGTMLRHICQLVCNAHAITDVLASNNSRLVSDEYQKRIATAIFPSASIMNHSCDSNIFFYFKDGKQLIVKAGRKIGEGENIYNCYGPHYRRMPVADRQEILMQQYFFSCRCCKCVDELTKGVSFSDQFQALKCDSCDQPIFLQTSNATKSSNCKHNNNMKLKEDQVNAICELQKKGEYFLEKDQIQEATKTFLACYNMASAVLFKYNSMYCNICDSLARCFVTTGNLVEAESLLKRSLDYVETRFGAASVEYKRELQKYLEIFPK